MPDPDEANCKQCEQPFTRNREWQVFCTPKCQQLWHRHKREQIRAWYQEQEAELEAAQ